MIIYSYIEGLNVKGSQKPNYVTLITWPYLVN